MPNIPYNFIVSELNLPLSITYEFRTRKDILYSCFFILSEFNPNYDEDTIPFDAYEFGLTDVIENSNAREIDFNIKVTVVEIIRQFLSRSGSDFFITMHYDNSDGKSFKRSLVFDKWYNEFKNYFPLEKFDIVIEVDEICFYRSCIIHKDHPEKQRLINIIS